MNARSYFFYFSFWMRSLTLGYGGASFMLSKIIFLLLLGAAKLFYFVNAYFVFFVGDIFFVGELFFIYFTFLPVVIIVVMGGIFPLNDFNTLLTLRQPII